MKSEKYKLAFFILLFFIFQLFRKRLKQIIQCLVSISVCLLKKLHELTSDDSSCGICL